MQSSAQCTSFVEVIGSGRPWFSWTQMSHKHSLNASPPGQNGCQFGRRHFRMHFLEWKWQNSNSNFTETCSHEFKVMAWHQTGNKPLSEPMKTQLIDTGGVELCIVSASHHNKTTMNFSTILPNWSLDWYFYITHWKRKFSTKFSSLAVTKIVIITNFGIHLVTKILCQKDFSALWLFLCPSKW